MDIILHGKGYFADIIKDWKWEDYSGLPGWPKNNHKDFMREKQ